MQNNTTMWVAGAIIVIIILGGLWYWMSAPSTPATNTADTTQTSGY